MSKRKREDHSPPSKQNRTKKVAETPVNPAFHAEHIFSLDDVSRIQSKLMIWYDGNCRQLPWRTHYKLSQDGAEPHQVTNDPYGVWVSEIMLQQTQVETVKPYYTRWMAKWPTVNDLAQASLDEVNEVWAGLGYYRRAKFLLEGAQMINRDMGGKMPTSKAELLKVKGIGEYTAGAIASICYKEQVPVVDGNVIRVMSRLRAIGAPQSDPKVKKLNWKLASELCQMDRPGDLNQSLMELGATVCKKALPDCVRCPIRSLCKAWSLQEGLGGSGKVAVKKEKSIKSFFKTAPKAAEQDVQDVEELALVNRSHHCDLCGDVESSPKVTLYPLTAKAIEKKTEYYVVCIIEHAASNSNSNSNSTSTINDDDTSASKNGRLLVVKRPPDGLLPNLWEFPSFSLDSQSINLKQLEQKALESVQEFGSLQGNSLSENQLTVQSVFTTPINHIFSHRVHVLYPVHITISSPSCIEPPQACETQWVSHSFQTSMSTGQRKCYKLVFSQLSSSKSISEVK